MLWWWESRAPILSSPPGSSLHNIVEIIGQGSLTNLFHSSKDYLSPHVELMIILMDCKCDWTMVIQSLKTALINKKNLVNSHDTSGGNFPFCEYFVNIPISPKWLSIQSTPILTSHQIRLYYCQPSVTLSPSIFTSSINSSHTLILSKIVTTLYSTSSLH